MRAALLANSPRLQRVDRDFAAERKQRRAAA